MSRASRARRIAAAAAYGGGGLTFLTVAGIGLLTAEARLARRLIGQPFGQVGPQTTGAYGHGPGDPIEVAVLGDSSAAGLGAESPEQTSAAIIASGLSALSGRPVRLSNVAVVGAESTGLEPQLDRLLVEFGAPDVAVILVGANDVTHRIRPSVAVRALVDAVTRLHELGAEVVVGTCPDLGTLTPVPQPLRSLGRRLSREMAAAQTIGVVEAGGRTVSLGALLGPEFAAAPHEMFSQDGFHPSAAGYARCAAALLPSVCAAVGVWTDGDHEQVPDRRRGEGVAPIAQAAVAAAEDAGTEVTPARVAGSERGPFGRWAMTLRRRRTPMPAAEAPHDDGSTAEGADDGGADPRQDDLATGP